MVERLQKIMAAAGVAPRRKCKEIIKQGRVRVDGRVVTETGLKVDPETARIEVRGRVIRPPKFVYLAMNKPKGVVTTMSDPRGRRTVADLLPKLGAVVKPIGRLDYNSEGLLLFTNDGELIERITHPRYGVWKTYRVDVRGTIAERKLERVRKGVILDGRRTAPAKLELVHYDQRRDLSIVDLSIHEGRKHQVKNMMQAVGVLVISLKRVKVGPIGLGRLRPGECKMLSKVQVTRLKKAAGLEQSQSA